MRSLLQRLSEDGRRHALMHPSFRDDPLESYERLEFLGDSVLGLAITEEIFRRWPTWSEGDLSKVKASIVSRVSCAVVAREMGLGDRMLELAPEDSDQVLAKSLSQHDRVLAALVESVIGGAFLELGYEETAAAVVASFADRIGHAVDNPGDAKSELQEFAQRHGDSVTYAVTAIEGPDHDRIFTSQVQMGEKNCSATGVGRSKKTSEQLAARALLDTLAEEEDMGTDGVVDAGSRE